MGEILESEWKRLEDVTWLLSLVEDVGRVLDEIDSQSTVEPYVDDETAEMLAALRDVALKAEYEEQVEEGA